MIILKLSVILCCGNFFNIVNPLCLYVCRYTNKYYYYYIKVIFKGKSSIPTDDLIPKAMRGRNQHSMAFQTPIANADVYKGQGLECLPRFSDLIC